MAESAREAVFSNAQEVLARLYPGRPRPANTRFSTDLPLGTGDGEIAAAQIAGLQSSVVVSEEGRAILFTLLFVHETNQKLVAAIKETHLLVRRAVSGDARGRCAIARRFAVWCAVCSSPA